jgi:hypothetical protein
MADKGFALGLYLPLGSTHTHQPTPSIALFQRKNLELCPQSNKDNWRTIKTSIQQVQICIQRFPEKLIKKASSVLNHQ